MKNKLKYAFSVLCALLMSTILVACGNNDCSKVAEKVSLSKAIYSEVEYENADTVKLEQDCDVVEIKGVIEAMSNSQKSTYGVDDVTHVVVVKFEFDKERTLECFEIKGDTTKVYSTDSSVENYVGTLTELLDNETSEDAYTNLILSANTKNYKLTAKYTDDTISEIEIKITATLATAESE